jgi:mannose-6-phosphate isomerase-like protein (cupin superfamily)
MPQITQQITNEIDLIPAKPDTSLLEAPKKFSQGDLKTLEEIVQFNPQFFIRRRIFATDSVQFNIYCLEPGQSNPLHKHPQSDEICYFVQGSGDVIIGDEIAAVQSGTTVHIPKDVGHEIRNIGTERMIVVPAQSPLPSTQAKIENPPIEYSRVEIS